MTLPLIQLLNERYINLFNKDEKAKYAREVWDIITASYAGIGGLKGNGFTSMQDMIDNVEMWKLIRQNGKIIAVALYRDKNGRKRVAIGTDGSVAGKRAMAAFVKEEAKQNRAYGEISGPSYKFFKRVLGDDYQQYLVPAAEVGALLGKDVEVIDEFSYRRTIGGTDSIKVLVGRPSGKPIKDTR